MPVIIPVTFNPADVSASIALTNNNYTATSGGAVGAGLAPQGVRASMALNPSAVVAWEITMTGLTQNWAAGVANVAYVLSNARGLGSNATAIGVYPSTGPGSQPVNTVYYNAMQLTSGNGVASSAGDVLTIIANGTNLYFSDPAMRTTSGVLWNNSTIANPVGNVGGFSFASVAPPYYPIWSEGESGGVGLLNDGTKPFSAFLTNFLAANPSVVTLSTQTPAATTKTITMAAPASPIIWTPFLFSGTLKGYTAPPPMTYNLDNGQPIPLPGITATGWATTLTIYATGTHTLAVTDGTISGSTLFTVTT